VEPMRPRLPRLEARPHIAGTRPVIPGTTPKREANRVMDLGLEGEVAIVTGGGAGIGAAIARRLGEEGCHVAVVDRRQEAETNEVVEVLEAMGVRGLAIQSDVASFTDAQTTVKRVLEELGRLDILVCNAGITRDGVVWKMTEEQWDQVIDVNLKGCFNYCRAVAAHFKETKYGKIVTISSINGLRGKFAQANYAASKGGVIALSKSLARDLGRFNVNVNVVAPGMVLTEMMETLAPEFQATAMAETVLGRFATPEDCANLVAFLCSDASRHITGEVIKIDGGQYI
jgi:3-oxoacyl-[acyl-carrier protein] reductase